MIYLSDESVAQLTFLVYRKVAIETLFATIITKNITEDTLDPISTKEVITDYAKSLKDIDELIASFVGEEGIKKNAKITYDLEMRTVFIESN